MDKSTLRLQKQIERDAIDKNHHHQWSEVMALTLSQLFEYRHCNVLHCYLPYRSEPNTMFAIEQAWNDGKRVVVPYFDDTTNLSTHGYRSIMKHTEYIRGDAIISGLYGVPQPETIRPVIEHEILTGASMILVPLLGFNQSLHRLGYGKGYYDAFLKSRTAFAYGYAFSMCFTDELTNEKHDIALDAIITEQGVARTLRI